MGTTFFRNLSTLESEIVELKGKKNYQASTRNTLTRLIETVEESNFIAERGVMAKFVCRTFRMGIKEQVALWNGCNEKQTCESGIRSAKSRTSDHLYNIFGDNFLTVFLMEDKEGLLEIDNIITALDNKDYLFDFLLIKEVSETVPNGSEKEYDLKDCVAEIELLTLLSKSNIEKLVSQVDMDKLAYLKSIANLPLIEYYRVNMAKANLLKALQKYGTSDSKKIIAEVQQEYDWLKLHKSLQQVLTAHADKADLMADCDENKVKKVRAILLNFYTEAGLTDWLHKNVDPLELNNALTYK